MTDAARADVLLNEIASFCRKLMGDDLTGVYVHGSLAFGCFTWATGDIDFLVIVQRKMTQQEKEQMIRFLLAAEAKAPPKGLEMSVLLLADCRHFVHPAPYELHYSRAHRAAYASDIAGYCQKLQGYDSDLAAHCTVMKTCGKAVCGLPIDAVFGDVPPAAYIDSICQDVQQAKTDILETPMYVTLNLCRVLAYLTEGKVLSKADGGLWGKAHLPKEYAPLLDAALRAYCAQGEFDQTEFAPAFAEDMLRRINDAK